MRRGGRAGAAEEGLGDSIAVVRDGSSGWRLEGSNRSASNF